MALSKGRGMKVISHGSAEVLWKPRSALTIGPSHRAKTSSNGCTGHGITGPANWPDLNPTENLCCIVKRKM